MKKVSKASKGSMLAKTSPTHLPRVVWILSIVIVLLGLVLQAASLYLSDWFHTEAISYTYMHKGTRRIHNVGPSRFGLHKIFYDGSSIIQTWKGRLESVKEKGFMAVQVAQQREAGNTVNFWGSVCPSACRTAILTRIRAYESIYALNNQLIFYLVVACTLAGLGTAWYLLVSDSVFVVGLLWGVAAVGSFCGIYYWRYRVREMWNVICMAQQIPVARMGKNYHMAVSASCLWFFATLIIMFGGFFSSWFFKRKMEKALNQQLVDTSDLCNPSSDAMAFNMFGPLNPTAPMKQSQHDLTGAGGGIDPGNLFAGVGFGPGGQPVGSTPQGPPSMWNNNLQL